MIKPSKIPVKMRRDDLQAPYHIEELLTVDGCWTRKNCSLIEGVATASFPMIQLDCPTFMDLWAVLTGKSKN